jgi:chromosome segregation ATPase
MTNLTTQLKEAQALIASLQAKADSADALSTELATTKASVEDLTEQLGNKETELNDIKASLDAVNTEKTALETQVADLTASAKSVDDAARELVAGLGMAKTPEASNTPVAKTRDEVIAEYLKLSGVAQGKFYQEHKDVINGNS